jgi:hypothetical protein
MSNLITWLNGNSGAIMAILTLAYIICTALICYFNWKANNTMLRLHRAIYRPVVICDFFIQHSLMYFRIRNIGLRSATNIKVGVLETPAPKAGRLSQSSIVTNGVSFLSPGSEIVTLYAGPGESERAKVDLAITYSDDDNKGFDEKATIDLQAWRTEDLGRENNSPLVQNLKKIEQHLGKIAGQ